jgi:thymidylate kinase
VSNYPIVVLEGPDGAGKTTLAKYLCEHHSFKYLHSTYRFKDRMDLYHWAQLELALKLAQHSPVVIDRWYMSEFVYAKVYRGGSRWPMMGRLLDRVALKHGITYVWCVPLDALKYAQRFETLRASRVEMYDHSLEQVRQEYLAQYKRVEGRLDHLHYDMGEQNPKDLFETSLLSRVACVHMSRPRFTDNIDDRLIAGNLVDPDILLVGDQSKPKTRRAVWPFFEHANCSLWLTQALELEKIPEHKLAWANAYDAAGVSQFPRLQRLVDLCVPKVVIALGRHAGKVVAELEIKVRAIKHPQWSRRFDPSDRREIAQLREFLT